MSTSAVTSERDVSAVCSQHRLKRRKANKHADNHGLSGNVRQGKHAFCFSLKSQERS
jgi:hypothetical protein